MLFPYTNKISLSRHNLALNMQSRKISNNISIYVRA
jgi:hypothetical protein